MKRLWIMLILGALLGAAVFQLADMPERAGHANGAALAAGTWTSAIASRPVEGFEPPSGDWELTIPGDHAPHAESRTEAWQLAAHLRGEDGQSHGLQFSLFRIALAPASTQPRSGWGVGEIYRGHLVLLGEGTTALAEERLGRNMMGLAGYDRSLHELRIDAWTLNFDAGAATSRWRLAALAGGYEIDLVLMPVKQAAGSGAANVPFRGYSFSRLDIQGEISTPGKRRAVAGTGWFDHLWGELPVPGESPVVSDRLQLQLDDGTDVSLMRSRRIDGAGTPPVDVTVIDPAGKVTVIGSQATSEIARNWQESGATIPKNMKLTLGDLDVSLEPIVGARDHGFMTPLWSGLFSAEGQRGGQPVTGMGTLQLSGSGLQ